MQCKHHCAATKCQAAQLACTRCGQMSMRASQRRTAACAQDTRREQDASQAASQDVAERHSNGAAVQNGASAAPRPVPYWQRVADEVKDPESIKVVAVELMAQAVFNFTSCNIVATATMWAGDTPALVPLQAVLGHFALLLVLVSSTQQISGGHFNPMVSTVMAVWGELRASRLPWYIAAQSVGGILGSVLQFQLLPQDMQTAQYAAVQAIPPGHTLFQGFLAEFAAAFVLIFLVCATALDRNGKPHRIPLVMALTVPLLLYTVGPISSMCINPARALGPAVAANFWQSHWVWWTAPFLGGLAAVVPYKLLHDAAAEGKGT